jgi:hypothetical protein
VSGFIRSLAEKAVHFSQNRNNVQDFFAKASHLGVQCPFACHKIIKQRVRNSGSCAPIEKEKNP